MADNLEQKLHFLALPIVEKNGAFIVDLHIRGERSSKVVELFLDTDTGITIEVCSAISREFAAQLDEQDVISGRYRLDVSSPGIDRPLKLHRQYKRNVGKTIKVKFNSDTGIKIIESKLLDAGETSILLAGKPNDVELFLKDIVETVVVPQLK